jgi:hypothetical protein
MEYGTPDIKTVFSHFSPDPEKMGRVGGIQISFFQANYERSPKKVVTDKDYHHKFPNFIPLFLIFCVVLPVSTAFCECSVIRIE